MTSFIVIEVEYLQESTFEQFVEVQNRILNPTTKKSVFNNKMRV